MTTKRQSKPKQPGNPVPQHYKKRRAAMDWWIDYTAGNLRTTGFRGLGW